MLLGGARSCSDGLLLVIAFCVQARGICALQGQCIEHASGSRAQHRAATYPPRFWSALSSTSVGQFWAADPAAVIFVLLHHRRGVKLISRLHRGEKCLSPCTAKPGRREQSCGEARVCTEGRARAGWGALSVGKAGLARGLGLGRASLSMHVRCLCGGRLEHLNGSRGFLWPGPAAVAGVLVPGRS